MSGGRYGATGPYRDDPGFRDYSDEPSSRGFGAAEIFEQIRNSVFKINNGANGVERAMKNIGTDKDSTQLRDKIHETSQNTHQLVQTTMRLIRSAGNKKIDKQQKLQLDRLRNDFQEAVQRFQGLQRKAAEKVKTTVMLSSSQAKSQKPLVDANPFADEDDTQQLIEDDRRARLQEQQVIIEDDLALIREREERIRQLESDILDVNEIFRDLGAMIQEQGETLDTIEANVEKTHGAVETGNEQLVKAAKYQKSSRKKMCCLLVTLLIIAIIVTVIVVLTTRH